MGIIDHTNKGRRKDDLLAYLLTQCRHYIEKIRPIRESADTGETSYNLYDETYNEFLESFHQTVEQHFHQTGQI